MPCVSEEEALAMNIRRFLFLCKQALSQKTTKGLKLKEVAGTFKGFSIKATFGSGNLVKRPALAFLKDGNEVSHGIYPIIVFVPESNHLLTCKGVSTDYDPPLCMSWLINDILDKPLQSTCFSDERGRKSYVRNDYKCDEVSEKIMIESVIEDINAMIKDYQYDRTQDSKKAKA